MAADVFRLDVLSDGRFMITVQKNIQKLSASFNVTLCNTVCRSKEEVYRCILIYRNAIEHMLFPSISRYLSCKDNLLNYDFQFIEPYLKEIRFRKILALLCRNNIKNFTYISMDNISFKRFYEICYRCLYVSEMKISGNEIIDLGPSLSRQMLMPIYMVLREYVSKESALYDFMHLQYLDI